MRFIVKGAPIEAPIELELRQDYPGSGQISLMANGRMVAWFTDQGLYAYHDGAHVLVLDHKDLIR